jgi:hypothetical protein
MKEHQALEVIKALETSREATLAEKIDLEKAMEVIRLEAEDKIRELDAKLSLRNGELDDAFAQITNLTNDLQMKEGQALEVIKALETSREATLAEKIDLEKAMEEYVTKAKNMENQIETIKAESELAASRRIIDLQKEKDDILTQYSALMSEKGNSFALKV